YPCYPPGLAVNCRRRRTPELSPALNSPGSGGLVRVPAQSRLEPRHLLGTRDGRSCADGRTAIAHHPVTFESSFCLCRRIYNQKRSDYGVIRPVRQAGRGVATEGVTDAGISASAFGELSGKVSLVNGRQSKPLKRLGLNEPPGNSLVDSWFWNIRRMNQRPLTSR